MHLRTLRIKNFRALADVSMEFSKGINVIVGPNAVGKTTILEAIRLAKSLLAQRVASEAQQTLISLGGISPHNPTQFIPSNIAQNPDQNLEISCGYQITQQEMDVIRNGAGQIATQLVRSRFGNNNIAEFIAFLSSAAGQSALTIATSDIRQAIQRVEQSNLVCRLDLQIDFKTGNVSSPDSVSAGFIGFLDQIQSFDQTKFSYFPADRALPRGEVGMQLGQQDSSLQLEAHNSQPSLKYNRLKNTIFATIISGEDGRNLIAQSFEQIFSGVLKGRKLGGVGISPYGTMSVDIVDESTGRKFDIDNLSSGEKGLVLTFLLISRTVSDDAVVLLDEPELHLNPAVCKDLLSYMVDQYVTPRNIQMIICSHSPEILAGAFEREECSLYHLRSGTEITKVRRSDHDEISDALRRVGTSESETLLYKGTIFVEGAHDVELLEVGFSSILRQYRIKDLGGRIEVEKHIISLQSSEEKLTTKLFFIFDKDRKPSELSNSENVGVLQLNKYCLENYLIDLDALTDLLMDHNVATVVVKNHGELLSIVKPMALAHLREQIVRDVFDEMRPPSSKTPNSTEADQDFELAAEACFAKVDFIKQIVSGIDRLQWIHEFQEKCESKRALLAPRWDTEWPSLCDGKRLFKELQVHFRIKISSLNFKKRVLAQMASGNKAENIKILEADLMRLLLNKS